MLQKIIGGTTIFIWLLMPVPAWATQSHGAPEGLFVHQIAHLFFAFSMGLLIYWLRKRGLVSRKGWRYIQYAALFLIAWNLDAAFSHWLVEQSGFIDVERIPGMRIKVIPKEGLTWIAYLYYLTKLDHLLCVPAMLYLLAGLRRLYRSSIPLRSEKEPAP